VHRSGLVCTVGYARNISVDSLKPSYSCPAPSGELDNEDLNRQQRSRDLTEALISTYDVPTLWSQHGIISDVIVSFHSCLFFYL